MEHQIYFQLNATIGTVILIVGASIGLLISYVSYVIYLRRRKAFYEKTTACVLRHKNGMFAFITQGMICQSKVPQEVFHFGIYKKYVKTKCLSAFDMAGNFPMVHAPEELKEYFVDIISLEFLKSEHAYNNHKSEAKIKSTRNDIIEQLRIFYSNPETDRLIMPLGITGINILEDTPQYTKVEVVLKRPGLLIGTRGKNIEELSIFMERRMGRKVEFKITESELYGI